MADVMFRVYLISFLSDICPLVACSCLFDTRLQCLDLTGAFYWSVLCFSHVLFLFLGKYSVRVYMSTEM